MKKGGLHFLSRKNQSLFDTNVQMKDVDNVEFVYDGVAFPDSGTAKVRARPTIKHFSTFGEGAGFAVPTPTVPVISSFTAPQISHTGKTASLSNGSAISMDDPEEEQIPIPPPPSTAPPPPPPQFIPPPPGHAPPPSPFSGETYSPVVLSSLEPPSMPPPKPPSVGMPDDVDLSVLRPPPMAPPKPPGYQISTSSPEDIPECPKFTPPLPPIEKPQSPITKVQKMPPPKPIRYSSMSNLLLSGQSDSHDGMLLENSSKNLKTVKEMSTSQILVPPVKPMRRNSSGIKLEEDIQDFKKNVQVALPKQPVSNSMAATVQTPSAAPDEISTLMKGSPTAERSSAMLSAQDVLHATPVNPMTKYSPLLNSKLQSLKTSEPPSGKEVTASPFALLMAAKERDKQRAAISRQNSTSSTDSTSGSIHLSDTRPNSFTVTPRTPLSGSASLSMESKHNTENPKVTYAKLAETSSSIQNKNPKSTASPTSPSGHHNGFDTTSFIPPPPEFANSDPEDEGPPSMLPPDPPTKRTDAASSLNSIHITNGSTNSTSITSPSTTPTITANPISQSKPKPQATPTSQAKVQHQVPPPTPPKVQVQPLPPTQPKIQPQAPPPSLLKTQTQTPPPTQPKFQPQAPPPSPPKLQPQAPPPTQPKIQYQAPPPTQPKFQPQAPPLPQLKSQAQAPPLTLPKAQPQAPPSVAASQATLLSILQKKMLEMDPKFAQSREADTGSDEWSSPPFDDEVGGPSLNSTPKPKSSAGLNIKELENKVTNKAQAKAPASTGLSKQQFGMTFLVRPGTKQPITPVPKTE
ncbi:proline-rich protein 36 [Clarias gariepinus]|uniref:proline-rich protein 36 n=1 Tax=Clarias gariepinus TaxID=13013 RepID=UPI00234D55CC|nr:proline-rich protein 36 [Clarias gariepinus]